MRKRDPVLVLISAYVIGTFMGYPVLADEFTGVMKQPRATSAVQTSRSTPTTDSSDIPRVTRAVERHERRAPSDASWIIRGTLTDVNH